MELDTSTHYPLIVVRMRPPTDWDDLYQETDGRLLHHFIVLDMRQAYRPPFAL